MNYIKTWLIYTISYFMIQSFMFSIGWVLMNGFRDPESWIAISKWPDWYMLLLGIPGIFIMVKVLVDNKIANGEI